MVEMYNKKPRVGIIGSGIFGLSCAIHLANDFEVVVFERDSDILKGATYANHNRHHYGFHYPRSPETAEQCLQSKHSFEKIYGKCCRWDFDNYYCVAEKNSKTTPEQYLQFCNLMKFQYKEQWPKNGILNPDKIALSLKVKEGIYDYNILRQLVEKRLSASKNKIKINLKHDVVEGNILPNGEKCLVTVHNGKKNEHQFNFVINAMYANFNRFCDWFQFPKHHLQFNLQELDIIELPVKQTLAITVQDGPFPSFMPLGFTNQYLLAHVEASQLIRESSKETTPLLNRVSYVPTDWLTIQNICSEYIPLLAQARYIKSIIVDRVVDASRLDTDARLTEITNHGQGCFSVFAAKIITCESTAAKVTKLLKEEL